MAWHSPRTWVSAEVVRARYFNEDVRDNLRALVGEFSFVNTQESTASTTYTDLTTTGPQVTVTPTTGIVTAFWGGYIFNSTANFFNGMSIELTGYQVANDQWGMFLESANINRQIQCMRGYQWSGATAGVPIQLIAKYRGENAAGSAGFHRRFLLAYGH